MNKADQTRKKILNLIKTQKGYKFLSLQYKAKGSGEEAIHTLGVKANLRKLYASDIDTLKKFKPKNILEKKVKKELTESLKISLAVGIGNHPAYTCKGVYLPICEGLKYHPKKKIYYIYGMQEKKTILQVGESPIVRHSKKTLIKNKLRKKLRLGKFRQFILPRVKTAKIQGNVLEIK